MMPLSQALVYNVDHLATAAEHWTKVADHRESTFADVRNQARSLNWEGAAADAMREHVEWDLQKAAFSADDLREAASIARSSAGDLKSLHRHLLSNLEDVQNDGFDVGEDYTAVNVRSPRTLEEHLARQQQGVEHSADLRMKATELTDADARVGARLQTATANEGKVQFTDYKADGGPVCDDPDYNDAFLRNLISRAGVGAAVGGAMTIPAGGVGAIPGMIIGGGLGGIEAFLEGVAGDGPKCK
jgi:broad specificity phosphatase PhoE